MITSKHLSKFIAVLLCVCLLACGFIVYAANTFDTAKIPEYQTRLFEDEVMSIDIQADPDEWKDLMDYAMAKEWISGDLIINGQRFSGIGIRTKGNSSLMQMGTDARYSLQFKANKYVRGQTFYGLDTFCVNNMMGDVTYMKDYLAYDVMSYIGVAAPLKNYAKVTVNGEDYGFGIALERYDKAFLDRVYSTAAGQLYNVKIGMGRRGDFEDMWRDVDNALPRAQFPMPAGGAPFSEEGRGGSRGAVGIGGMVVGVMGVGGFSMGGGGSLIYTDDEIGSYGAIFENAIFSSVSDNDKRRVITALENLNAGTDLERYFDVDSILRYFAAHTVVVNLDSYTSNMQQNFYLYERGGKITILPWDYNLAFGGFMSGTASNTVNFPIDTPVSGVSMEDRPLLNMLLGVDEYRERYHGYLLQIVEGYFESGMFERTILGLNAKINDFVKNDVNMFYSYEQYEASLPVMIEFGYLRAKSIRGQLDGTIPSTSSGQNADGSTLVDASNINLSALGTMIGGGMGGRGGFAVPADGSGMPGGEDGQGGVTGVRGDSSQGGRFGVPIGGFGMPVGDMLDLDVMMQAMPIIMGADGELSEEDKNALLELGLTEEQIEVFSGMQGGVPGGGRLPGGGGQGGVPGGGGPGGFPGPNVMSSSAGTTQPGMNIGYIITVAVSLLLLAGAIVIVAKPRKDTI